MNTREESRGRNRGLEALVMTGTACCLMAAHAGDMRSPTLNPVRFHGAPPVPAVTLVRMARRLPRS